MVPINGKDAAAIGTILNGGNHPSGTNRMEVAAIATKDSRTLSPILCKGDNFLGRRIKSVLSKCKRCNATLVVSFNSDPLSCNSCNLARNLSLVIGGLGTAG